MAVTEVLSLSNSDVSNTFEDLAKPEPRQQIITASSGQLKQQRSESRFLHCTSRDNSNSTVTQASIQTLPQCARVHSNSNRCINI